MYESSPRAAVHRVQILGKRTREDLTAWSASRRKGSGRIPQSGSPAASGTGPFCRSRGVRGGPKYIRHRLRAVASNGAGIRDPGPEGFPMAKFRIENVVASTSLGHELDLKAIALALGGSEYEPEQFPGLLYRIKEPKTAILLFRSGKVVCTGAKSLENVKTAIDLVSNQIDAAGISIKKEHELEVENIDATYDGGAPRDLNPLAIIRE